MADEGLMSQQHDDGSLWDELSHQHNREIQWHQSRVAAAAEQSTAVRRAADASAAALRTAAQYSGAALSAAAAGAREGYRRMEMEADRRRRRQRGVMMTHIANTPSAAAVDAAGLAEFGLESASHPRGVAGGAGFGGGGDAAASLLANEYEQGGAGTGLGVGIGEAGDGGRPPGDGGAAGNNNNFVFLRNFRLRSRGEGWGAVANLDLFFTSVYNYYYHGGMAPIVGNGIVDLVSLFFTLWLSVFLFAYLDWSALATCTDDRTCRPDFQNYIIEKPFSNASLYNFLVILYCLLFTCYGCFAVLSFLATVRDAFEAKAFFEDWLGISARKLEGGAVEWDEIVQKVVRLQETGEHRVAIHGQEINALVVAQRILRKENFMVAFFNRNILDLTVPVPIGWLNNRAFFSKSLEWSIHFTILSYMYNHKYQIRPAFYLEPSSLRRRLVVCGIAHAIFMPFLLFFMMLHFFMLNLYDWRSSKQYLGPREWSPVAKWTFREFNELPHAFERRIGPSYEAAEDYLKLFTQSAALTAAGRALAFLSGSLAAVLVAFAAVNDSILLHVKLGQWNLLWYVGILGVIFSVSRGVLPESKLHRPSTRNLFAEMDSALERVASHTHYFPEIWKKRGWDKQTQQAFSGMFQYKAKLFIMEVISVVLAPIILCVSLPKCAPSICSFVQKVKMEVPGAGDVCGYSIFDFDAFEDECWEGEQMRRGEPSPSGLDVSGVSARPKRSPELQMKLDSRPKTRMGKMEKSFFSFKAVHPSWKCSSSGQDLLDRVESYQYQRALALARERRHHIEAAARQLETLRQLEQRRGSEVETRVTLDGANMNESYISRNRTASGADAGADSGGGGSIQMKREDSQKNESSQDTLGELRSYAPHQYGPAGPRVHFQDRGSLQQSLGSGVPNIEGLGLSRTGSVIPSSSSTLPTLGPQGSAASVLHYADTGLSTELQRVLNRSTLDPNMSVAGSVLGAAFDHQSIPSLSQLGPLSTLHSSVLDDDDDALDRNAQRQYMWLERYHSAQAQQQQNEEGTPSLSQVDAAHAERNYSPAESNAHHQRVADGVSEGNGRTDINNSS